VGRSLHGQVPLVTAASSAIGEDISLAEAGAGGRHRRPAHRPAGRAGREAANGGTRVL
jgi:hypothetical protein